MPRVHNPVIPGRKLLGGFLSESFPGAKDVVEATDTSLRARFETAEAAKAAMKKGVITAIGDQIVHAAGKWDGDEEKDPFA